MTDTAKNLDFILGVAYQAEVMGKKSVDVAESLFNSATHDDPSFTQTALQKLAELSKIKPQKCFISKTNAGFLSRMLATV